MDDSLPSPAAKRSIHKSNIPAMNGGSSKRFRRQPPPLTVPSGHVLFRILCPTSISGGVIGKSGAIVKQLQKDTVTKIRVEESPPGSDERVIVAIGSNVVNKKVTLKGEEGGVDIEISAAQEAIVKIFERILEVSAEAGGGESEETLGGVVSCRLLAESSQVGAVIGKGGKIIEKIREDTGCKIRVLKSENLPACASANEELIEIEGDSLAVKKALIAISRRLQDFPPAGGAQTGWTRPHETISHETLHSMHVDLPRPNSALPHMLGGSVPYASADYPFSLEAERVPTLDPNTEQQEVVFRLLCSNDRVGGVIGKGGTIVKALQNETGASISVGSSVAECDERLITISAVENPESRYSPAQKATILVFNRSVEAGFEKGLDSGSSNESSVSARVIVSPNQIGCLMGKGGVIIEEMRQATGASISIVKQDQVANGSLKDEVVQIAGMFVCVQNALYKVTSRLRDNLSGGRISNGAATWSNSSMISDKVPYGISKDPSSRGSYASIGVPNNPNRYSVAAPSTEHFGLYHNYDHPSSQQAVGGVNLGSTLDVARGLASVKGGLELGSGLRSVVVRNTTVEIVVPENLIGSIYGENGSNLARLRQISRANVVVHEPHPGTTDRVVVISGRPDETQAAQSLLQAFILTG